MEISPRDDPINLILSVTSNDLDKARRVLSPDENFTPFQASEPRQILSPELISEALCTAIELGLYDMVKLFIEFGADLEARFCGSRPIHYAVRTMDLSLIQLLISHGVNVNGTSNGGDSPLHFVVTQVSRRDTANCRSEDIIDVLIQAGADIDIRNKGGLTPLASACRRDRCEIAKYLIQSGANVNPVNEEGDSPLILAIESGYYPDSELVGLLLAAGADPDHKNSWGQTPLSAAVRVCSESNLVGQLIIEQLIGHNCNVDPGFNGKSIIHLAIDRGQDRVVERLIRAGCDINDLDKFGYSPLERLSKGGKLDLVKLLLASGARANLTQRLGDYLLKNQWYFSHLGEIHDLLQSWEKTVAPLRHFCRIALRRHWKKNSDSVISSLPLPTQIKEYLLCLIL